MANGGNGATGASARQNILMVHKSVIDFAIRRRQSTVENIVR